jgi:hypothetical protein
MSTHHWHRCSCGFEWECCDETCWTNGLCRRCEDQRLADWLMARDYHMTQPPLPGLPAPQPNSPSLFQEV